MRPSDYFRKWEQPTIEQLAECEPEGPLPPDVAHPAFRFVVQAILNMQIEIVREIVRLRSVKGTPDDATPNA